MVAKPVRIKGSPHPHSRLTIPVAVRGVLGRREFLAALRAPTEAQRAADHLANIADWKGRIAAARARLAGDLRHLSDREVSALCGAWYAARVSEVESLGPLNAKRWDIEEQDLIDRIDRDEEDPTWWEFTPDPKDIAEAEHILTERGLVAVAPVSVQRFARQLHLTKIDAARTLLRRAEGDFRPDPVADMFAKELPRVAPSAPPPAPPKAAPPVTFETLAKGWARDAGYDPDARPIPRNYYDRKTTAARLASFVGHDDATRLTKADVARWKEHMQKAGKSIKTVRNDLSEISGLWSWGVRHGLVEANVIDGLLPPKKALQSDKKPVRDYEPDAEVAMILRAAREESTPALRFLPWVLAMTGARLGEIVQSRKEDIETKEGVVVLRIHDDPGDRLPGEAKRSLKNAASRRIVPIHPALLTEGFLDYVSALPDRSPLFPDIEPDRLFGSRTNIAQKTISRWIRGLGLDDERISPSHSFRHSFITAARKARIPREPRDAITGHSGKQNEADDYGVSVRDMPVILYEAIVKIPAPISNRTSE